MKKIVLVIAAISSSLLYSCEKEDNVAKTIDDGKETPANITVNHQQSSSTITDSTETEEPQNEMKIDGGAYANSFIQDYNHADSITLYAYAKNDLLVFSTFIRGDMASQKLNDSLSKAIGDTCFNHYMARTFANCDTLTGIDILSDIDYDENHPAGTSLKDIIRFSYSSPLSFIKSGYMEKAPDDEYAISNGLLGGYKSFYTVASTTASEMKPISFFEDYAIISIDHLPATKGTYEFTVRMDFSGKVIEKKEVFEYK